MNKLLSIITLCGALLTSNVQAHGDHGVISGQKAVSIAATHIQKMTFKDAGFEVGKLDESWKNIDKSQLSIASVEDNFYVVSASNSTTERKLYFQVIKNGQVKAVKYINEF
ncbi:DUF6488 family protein [Planctobacterium marinum]|uniref:DUF6488 family protein n=2 Tax=Alteromonadales TaxID=135622 RepID=UPI001E2CA8CC|nr:DUF6488 family protein [Planctobacterium marinum]MCC2605309.1 DUF6488 family protein [Planctobacterium marinum]